MDNPIIRWANEADLSTIVAIYNEAVMIHATADTEVVTMGQRKAWFHAHSPDAYPIWVAERNGTIEGWLSMSAYRPGRGALRSVAEVSYYVRLTARRSGIGSALMEEALRAAPGLRFKSLFAILLENNSASIALLRKFGFSQWAHLPRVAQFGDFEVGQVYFGKHLTL